MIERVAVLSDVHGVLPALEAVLAEPDVRSADRIVLTGDVAAGPQPVEVLDALTALGDRVVWVRGNADRELAQLFDGGDTVIPDPIAPWAAARLRRDQRDLLAALPTTRRLSIEGLGEVLFCHGTPRDDAEVVLVDSRPDRFGDVLSDIDETITTVVCGHTHMPFVRITHGVLVVNPGSVGMPYGRAGAHWALLGPGVALRHTTFDLDEACRRIAAESSYENAAEWADEYVRARNTDLDALRVFGPMDGRA